MTKVDGKNVQHRLIRCVSMDEFYAILTGEKDAFYKMCMELPVIINGIVNEEESVSVPHDTVIRELKKIAALYSGQPEELAMATAVYMLGFNTYKGFRSQTEIRPNDENEGQLRLLYAFAKAFDGAAE